MPTSMKRRLRGRRHPGSRRNKISLALLEIQTHLVEFVNAKGRVAELFGNETLAIQLVKAARALADLDASRLARVLSYLQSEDGHVTGEISRLTHLAMLSELKGPLLLDKMVTRKAQLDGWIEAMSGKDPARLTP